MLKNLNDLKNVVGVYKFYDKNNNLLYIGKALNLKARVSSYFKESRNERPHIISMIALIDRVEIVETDNEVESLILESALIKKYQPKFNLNLKDDKSFSWIYISTKEKFPKVSIVRSIKKDEYKKGKLFGPYPKGESIRKVFDYMRKLYPFRSCNRLKGPCLYAHLNLCPAPCQNIVTSSEYKKNISNIIKFLQGKQKNIVRNLEKEMRYYALEEDFEQAGALRDKIKDLEYISQRIDNSVFNSEKEYVDYRYERIKNSMEYVQKKLNVQKIRRIECYDVSNIKGKFAYGAMSVSIDNKLAYDKYRIFKIKDEKKPDDISMLKEVLLRRIKYLNSKYVENSFSEKPDLIIIDGGSTHLLSLYKLISKDIGLLGISKGKHLKKRDKKKKDEFWLMSENKAKRFQIKYPHLFIQLRDEAHRFGIKYYRKSIIKYSQISELDMIEGVGTKRKKKLLSKFNSLKDIKKANISQINNVLKNEKVSKAIYDHFKN